MSKGSGVLAVGRHSVSILRRYAHHGMQGVVCSSGTDALKLLKSAKSSIVLCDSHLPDMSGLELLDSVIRAHPDTAFVTCAPPKKLRDALLAMIAGASGFITTQQDFHAIARQFESAVRRSSMIRRFEKSQARERMSANSRRRRIRTRRQPA